MTDKEILQYSIGYLYGTIYNNSITNRDALLNLKHTILRIKDPEYQEPDYENYEVDNNIKDQMDGYDYDSDADQQSPDFW